jgi:D-beta-D-heptose 7-phosphate kinase/D-beta-D-heptose 1-phosphate adenosyltransferase
MCRPDVLVKGGDYADKDIVGSDIVQEVYTAPILEGISTSKIIGVLRDQC